MDNTMEYRLSLLMDDEASEFETRRLVEDISKNPHMRKRWLEMNKHRAALKKELLLPNLDLTSKIQSEISQTPSLKIKHRSWQILNFQPSRYVRTCSYLFGLCFTLSFLLFDLPSSSQKLLKSTSPSTALVSTLDTDLLNNLGKNFNGNLQNYRLVSNNQIEANYLLKNSENVKLRVFFKDAGNLTNFNFINEGITINLKKGNKPMIINFSSEKLSDKRLIKISDSILNN